MRRRSRGCHLIHGPAAETSYSAAGLIKYSRARVPSHDGFAPSGHDPNANSHGLLDGQRTIGPFDGFWQRPIVHRDVDVTAGLKFMRLNFGHLSAEDRSAILEMTEDTKPGFARGTTLFFK